LKKNAIDVMKINKKGRLKNYFNEIPGERERGHLQSILRHLFFSLFIFIPFLTVIFINKGELME